ncbi:MAG TPA: type II secretion system protein GspJ [Chthoniobacteraceae bacterium]|jgi:type II secretion system protein J|nr:type II secretion system protein GspJ [Chthoniobacteraceae bacterium]
MTFAPAYRGFTLLEVVLATIAGALILVAIYAVFQQAIHLRDGATQRVRDTQTRMRAADVVRNDLRNAMISGGELASIVEGDCAGNDGIDNAQPGYLKFTTTTGKDTDDALYGDVQQVEYYVLKGSGTNANSGSLVRAVTRDLLETTTPQAEDEPILENVASMQVAFYDGTNWQTSWEYNTADSGTDSASTSGSSASTSGSGAETIPAAVRVDIQQAPPDLKSPTPPPIEVLVPWTTQPFTSPTPAPSAS